MGFNPPLGILVKNPIGILVFGIGVKVVYLVALILGLAAAGTGLARAWFTWGSPNKDKKEKYKKHSKGLGIAFLVIFVVVTLVDMLIVSGWPPAWMPEGGNNNG